MMRIEPLAPPEQLRQADAWCAKAGDKLHSAFLEVKRATEQLVIAQTSLSQAVAVCSDVHRPRVLGAGTPHRSATPQRDHLEDTMTGRVWSDIALGLTHPALHSPHGPSTATSTATW
jgi:hypothetical protein